MRKQNVKFVKRRSGDTTQPGSAHTVHLIVNSKLHQLIANPLLKGFSELYGADAHTV